jgi:sugar lactone lactonase YvrE
MDARTTLAATLLWPCAAQLGEGPIWLSARNELWFVDIKQGRLHCLTPASGERRVFDLGGAPSFIVPMSDGALLVGSGRKLLRVKQGVVTDTVATIDMPAHNRTNDATVDPAGVLWFGTMDDEETAATGRVYRFDGTLSEAGGACTITNGPAVSPDGRWLYHVDTLAGLIWRFAIGDEARTLRDGTVFVRIDPKDGHPDGVTIDSEGCVWVGLWGGWSARRYGPDGTLRATVTVPCANVTKVAFGGPELRTGYITTARVGLSASALEGQPDAGGLFSFAAPAAGLAATPLRLR